MAKFSARTKTGIDLWLETDANPETGNTTFEDAGGAEYIFSGFLGSQRPGDATCELIPSGTGCLGRYTPGTWIAASAPTARVTRTATGATFSINRSDLGNTDELNFYGVVGGDPPERAPGRGTFNYSLALAGPRPEAAKPVEGADKAGGKPEGSVAVLTLAEHNYNAFEPAAFAAAVDRLSGGSLRIDITEGYRF